MCWDFVSVTLFDSFPGAWSGAGEWEDWLGPSSDSGCGRGSRLLAGETTRAGSRMDTLVGLDTLSGQEGEV